MRCLLAAIPLLFSGSLFGQIAFEVASIKPSAPQEQGRVSSRHSVDKGRLNYTNVSPADLVAEAYGVQHTQISGPDWFNSVRFDVMAKIPDDATRQGIPEMLRTLLAARFGLKLHEETKELTIYALVAAKSGPKMPKAESAGGVSSNSKKALKHLSARMTLASLADYLSQQLDRPVVDRSGLDGPYQIDLEWTPDTALAPGSDTAGPSLFTALQEQLGLRLAAEKGPVRLLVVDSIDKVPTEN